MSSKMPKSTFRKTTSPNQSPTFPKKKRIPKDQKICELKSELHLSREENARLRMELERLKRGGGRSSSESLTQTQPPVQSVNEEQQTKFRDAMRAVKKVTVKQEMCIRTLRKKAKQRRQELKHKDEQIKTLSLKLMSLENYNKTLQKSQANKDLLAKNKELQSALDEIRQRNDELEELLDRKESQLESLHKQPNGPKKLRNGRDTPSDGESVGSGSLQSVSTSQSASTAGDFDVARLKVELARKTEKILELQMKLENTKDELHDLKQFGSFPSNNENNGFGNAKAFPSGQPIADDWTDADTDNEADFEGMQFGESFFKPKKGENVDFW